MADLLLFFIVSQNRKIVKHKGSKLKLSQWKNLGLWKRDFLIHQRVLFFFPPIMKLVELNSRIGLKISTSK